MPLRKLHNADHFVYQCTGVEGGTPVVYLPGVHGCWTPLEQARPLFADALSLIEVAYPLYDQWTLEHYAEELATMLDSLELDSVHIIGESFGSLVGWQFGLMYPSRVRSHILVGGFCKAPGMYVAATAGLGLSFLPSVAFDMIVDTYVSYKNIRGEPRKAYGVKSYPAVRGSKGQRATANRMRLIQQADFRHQLAKITFPVRYIGGGKDRVIPVLREVATLKRQLPTSTSFESHLIPNDSHAIIASNPKVTVKYINMWILEIEKKIG